MSLFTSEIMGFIGTIDMKYTAKGSAVCNVSVAHTNRFKSGDEWKEETIWVKLVFWNETAETINKYFKKGDGIWARGLIKANPYTDKQGNAAASLEMNVREWQFPPVKKNGDTSAAPQHHDIVDENDLSKIDF